MKQIIKHLNKHGLYYEVYKIMDEIRIEIIWGDWKHDHARTDYVMNQIGYRKTSEIVTEENGDDSYSSIHCYNKINY